MTREYDPAFKPRERHWSELAELVPARPRPHIYKQGRFWWVRYPIGNPVVRHSSLAYASLPAIVAAHQKVQLK